MKSRETENRESLECIVEDGKKKEGLIGKARLAVSATVFADVVQSIFTDYPVLHYLMPEISYDAALFIDLGIAFPTMLLSNFGISKIRKKILPYEKKLRLQDDTKFVKELIEYRIEESGISRIRFDASAIKKLAEVSGEDYAHFSSIPPFYSKRGNTAHYDFGRMADFYSGLAAIDAVDNGKKVITGGDIARVWRRAFWVNDYAFQEPGIRERLSAAICEVKGRIGRNGHPINQVKENPADQIVRQLMDTGRIWKEAGLAYEAKGYSRPIFERIGAAVRRVLS